MSKFPLKTWLAIALSVSVCGVTTRAASPELSSVLPRGGQRRTDVDLTLSGARLSDAQEILFYDPGFTVKKLDVAKPEQLKVKLAIAPDATLGEHALRVRTATGISELRTFWVGALPTIGEKEPNNAFEKPQKIELNTTIEGVIQNEDVDYFLIDAKKGQRISVEVEGIRLGDALFDPAITILDKKHNEVASDDDSALLLQDPTVSMIAPRDAQYIIELRDSSYGGNGNFHYRMHVGTFPRPQAVFPAGGKVGTDLAVQFISDPAEALSQTLHLPTKSDAMFRVFAQANNQIAPSPNYLRVSPFDNVLEVEPNDGPGSATPVAKEIPVALNGILSKPGDDDWFKFHAKKDQVLDINVYARRLRSPIDSMLWVCDAKGNLLAQNDDTTGPDSYLRFQVPADGDYTLCVLDHLHAGGPDYVYRVEITPAAPRVELAIPLVAPNSQERQTIVVPRGNCYATLIRATRTDFGGELKLHVDGLPAGVTTAQENVATNLDTIPVVFEASADAPTGAKLCDVVADSTDPKQPVTSEFTQAADLVVGGNQIPYYQAKVHQLAVAVADEAPFKLKIVQPKVPLVQNGSMQLKVVAERKPGFKAPISVAMLFNPPGVGSGGATIAEGATETTIPLNANAEAQAKTWKICVIASSDAGSGPVWISSKFADLEIAPAFVAGQIQMAAAERGKPAQVLCKLDQKTPFDGKAQVQLLGLPAECTAAPKEITSKDDKIIFDVQTTDKSPTGQHNALFCSLTLTKDGEPITQTFGGGGVIRIDAPPPGEKPQAAQAKQTGASAPVLSRLEKLRQQQAQREQSGSGARQ